jgi:hypothetical protein
MAYAKKQTQSSNAGGRLADYAEVKDRLLKFRQKYPDGSINTELVSWENGIVVVKAYIYRNPEEQYKGLIAATGYAYENEEKGHVNATSALENCETSAVGRALAFLGFDVRKSIASKLEMELAKAGQEKIEQDRKEGKKVELKHSVSKSPLQQLSERFNQLAKTPEEKANVKKELVKEVGAFSSFAQMKPEQVNKALAYLNKK